MEELINKTYDQNAKLQIKLKNYENEIKRIKIENKRLKDENVGTKDKNDDLQNKNYIFFLHQ